MDNFETIYSSLIRIAEKQITKYYLKVEPMELVNQAYIECDAKGIEFTVDNAVKFLFEGVHIETSHHKIHKHNEFYKQCPENERYCKKCNESKPIAAFYVINKFKAADISHDCKECRIASAMSRYEQNKAEWLIKSKQYKDANKERIKLKKQLYHKANVSHEVRHRTGIKIELKEKVNTLTESYIKSLLRRSKIYNPTKQQIEEKRQQVIILRQRKAPKKISPRTKNIAA